MALADSALVLGDVGVMPCDGPMDTTRAAGDRLALEVARREAGDGSALDVAGGRRGCDAGDASLVPGAK